MTLNKFNLEKGFTLIEFIVVFSIIAILSTTGIASFVSYSRSQEVNVAAQDFVTMLNKAKSRTMSQLVQDKNGDSMCSSGQFTGYSVNFCEPSGTCDEDNKEYKLNIICGGSDSYVGNPLETKSLSINVKFSVAPSVTTRSFLFLVKNGGIVGADSGGTVITISGYNDTITRAITIYPDGRILTN